LNVPYFWIKTKEKRTYNGAGQDARWGGVDRWEGRFSSMKKGVLGQILGKLSPRVKIDWGSFATMEKWEFQEFGDGTSPLTGRGGKSGSDDEEQFL